MKRVEETAVAAHCIISNIPYHRDISLLHKSQAKNQLKMKNGFDSPKNFIEQLLPLAENAANKLQMDPYLLLAQAALETAWGQKILSKANGETTYNLFNIKSHNKNTMGTLVAASEEMSGVLHQETSYFRAYDSFKSSFMDYVSFLKSNPRYAKALRYAANPEQFLYSLQQAHFATDSLYAAKVLKIYDKLTQHIA